MYRYFCRASNAAAARTRMLAPFEAFRTRARRHVSAVIAAKIYPFWRIFSLLSPPARLPRLPLLTPPLPPPGQPAPSKFSRLAYLTGLMLA